MTGAATRGVLKESCSENFLKIHREHLYQSLFLNKVAGCRLQLYQKGDSVQVFSGEFHEILRRPALKNRTSTTDYFYYE